MYPKNAASPERIAVGAVVQISDGAVQTSGVSITVVPQGGTTAAGGGTTSYEQGVVFYVPTQAETNYTSFIVTAYKTGCIPVSATVVTSASATAGKVVLSGETHTSAVIPTVTTLTNLPAITSGWLTAAGIAASALNGKGDWNIGKTGYSLTQAFPANFSAMSISATTGLVDITQAAADKVWSTTARVLTAGTNIALAKGTGVTGFNDLDAAGVAAATWNAATVTYGTAGSYGLLVETNLDAPVSGATAPTAAAVADAVWDEAIAGHLGAGTTGEALNAAGSAGDPWTTTLPGAYTGSQAGKMLSDILTDTAVIGAAGAGLTAVPWNAAWDAEVQSECADALNAYDPPTNTEMVAAFTEIKGATWSAATDTIEHIRDKLTDIETDTAEIGVAGAGLTALATAANLATATGYIDTEVAAIKAKTDSLTFTVAGQVDANMQYVNDVQLAGNGTTIPMDAA